MRYSFILIFLIFMPLSASAFTYNNNPADATLEQLYSKNSSVRKKATETLIADVANHDHIIKKIIENIEKISQPFAVYPHTKTEMKARFKQHRIDHTTETSLKTLSEIIKLAPQKAKNLSVFFNSQNHLMIHTGFALIGSLHDIAQQKEIVTYIPQIKAHIIKAASYSPYARKEFLKDGLWALKIIGTPEAKQASKEAEQAFKSKEQVQLGIEKTDNNALKTSDPTTWKTRQFEAIGQQMKQLVFALNNYYGKYGTNPRKAPSLEAFQQEGLISSQPSTELDNIAFWIGEYSAHGRTHYMVIAGQKTQDHIPDGAAFTVNEASAIYHAARMGSLYLTNARGHSDCVTGSTYNSNNPEKACILVGWAN